MRYFLLLISLFALVLTSCQSATTSSTQVAANPAPATTATPVKPDNHAKDDDAPRLTIAEAKAAFDKGEALFIDSRSEQAFKDDHIKGAINITLQDDPSKYGKIPKGKKIIVYCS
jgi:3-mercaptopyruvate sulfurtransferase SseA